MRCCTACVYSPSDPIHMNVTLSADPVAFEVALQSARKPSQPPGSNARYFAAVEGALLGKLEEVWDTLAGALRATYVQGKMGAQMMIDSAVHRVEELITNAGDRAKPLLDELLRRMRKFVTELVAGTINSLPDMWSVGGKSFRLTSIKCSHSLALSASLKTSLHQLFELASDGKIEVEAEYGIAT